MCSTARWHYVERVAGSRIFQRQGIKNAHRYRPFLIPLPAPRSNCDMGADKAAPAEGGGVRDRQRRGRVGSVRGILWFAPLRSTLRGSGQPFL
jgi:hypothetical protein